MNVCVGATRWVFRFNRFVAKIPRLDSWKLFLCGLLANMQEAIEGCLSVDVAEPKKGSGDRILEIAV